MRVGNLDREALKELFVDGIEKLLLLGEIFDGLCRRVDRFVEAIETLQESIAAKGLRSQRVDNFFNFGRDDVAAGEVGIVKDRAEDAFRQQMLDEHLFDSLRG